MILQALVKRYEDLLSRGDGNVPRLGWGKTKVSFGLNLNENGEVEGLFPLKVPQKTGKKETMSPRILEVPLPVKRAVLPGMQRAALQSARQGGDACCQSHFEILCRMEPRTDGKPALLRRK